MHLCFADVFGPFARVLASSGAAVVDGLSDPAAREEGIAMTPAFEASLGVSARRPIRGDACGSAVGSAAAEPPGA